MTKILRPVDPAKRKPAIVTDNPMFKGLNCSGVVIVRYINKSVSEDFSALSFAFFDHADNIWENADPLEHFFANKENKVIEWYEEIDIESLFPTDYEAKTAASNASGGRFDRHLSHQEGQNYFENFLLKKLKS